MKLGLGIDTGGTFTDAVLYDFDANTVLHTAKSETTKEDLAVGIRAVLTALPASLLPQVQMVSLSTTLATNACVEGKGGRARLILIGGFPKVVRESGARYGLPPAEEITMLPGGCDRFGQVECEPDFDALLADCADWIGTVDAVAVVEHQGVANPQFERQAKALIEQRYGVPVICGHELFSDYNYLQRGASALLNAKLIVVIQEFLAAIRSSLGACGMQAPVVIVRSDGSLMSGDFAALRPVETILCGPAASVIGGIHLTHSPNSLLVDMGGTTTDIAVVRDGYPVPTKDGVHIGAWRTFVKSVQIDTIGLGGDSIVTRDRKGGLAIGPRRAMPLCAAAQRWPHIREELAALEAAEIVSTHPLNEYLCLLRDVSDDPAYSELERALCRLLRGGAVQADRAAEAIGSDVYRFSSARLEENGAVLRCALTVTDVMHIRQDFLAYDAETSRLGAAFLARCLHLSVDELCALVYDRVELALYAQCVKLLLRQEYGEVAGDGVDGQLARLIDKSWRLAQQDAEPFFRFGFATSAVCVGIGAPTHIFLPAVAQALGTVCEIPPYAAVANAVGAIVGNVAVRYTVEIKPNYTEGGYTVFGLEQPRAFDEREPAEVYALEQARRGAEQEARRRGVTGTLDIQCAVRAHTARLGDGGEEAEEILLGLQAVATADGALSGKE